MSFAECVLMWITSFIIYRAAEDDIDRSIKDYGYPKRHLIWAKYLATGCMVLSNGAILIFVIDKIAKMIG